MCVNLKVLPHHYSLLASCPAGGMEAIRKLLFIRLLISMGPSDRAEQICRSSDTVGQSLIYEVESKLARVFHSGSQPDPLDDLIRSQITIAPSRMLRIALMHRYQQTIDFTVKDCGGDSKFKGAENTP